MRVFGTRTQSMWYDCHCLHTSVFLWAGLYGIICFGFIPWSHALCNIPYSSDVIKLNQWSGVIQSPGLTIGQYPNDQDCMWRIAVSRGSKVELTIDVLRIEEGLFESGPPNSKTCFDYLRVEDSQEVIGTFCGTNDTPMTLTSKDETLTVYFHSDAAQKGFGFRATYSGLCGGEITQDTIIASPGFPNPPPEGVTCSWTVKPSGGQQQVSVIRVLGIEDQQSGRDLKMLPPPCGESPFTINTGVDDQSSQTELCLLDTVDAHVDNYTLTYAVVDGVEPWTGQLNARFTEERGCASLCIHFTKCTDSPEQINGQLDYKCECVPNYTGKNCEVEISLIDPCAVHSCEQGTCKNLPFGERRCMCFEGYTGESCEVSLHTPCTGVDCQHGGECVVLDQVDYVCECAKHSGYTGTLCNIPVGSGYCTQEVDLVQGSGTLWMDTPAGQMDFQPCPGNTQGNATRYCFADPYSPTGGVWTRPDLSHCVSLEVFQLSLDATQLLDPSSTSPKTPASILNITSRLASITQSVIMTNDNHALYSGDLLVAADVIKTISIATELTTFMQTQEALDLTQKYTQAVDNLVDPKTEYMWKNARSDLVGKQVSTVVQSTQNLISSLFLRRAALSYGTAKMRRDRGMFVDDRDDQMGREMYRLTSRNVDIYVSQYGTANANPSVLFNGNTSSVGFSSSILTQWLQQTQNPITVYIAQFQSIANLLSFKEDKLNGSRNSNTSIVNSDVLSAAVLNVPENYYNYLRRPIILTFSLQDPRLSQSLTKKCVFMNMSATSFRDKWSGKGCTLKSSNDSHVVCYCYHLTNFAVLMDVYQTQDALDRGQDVVLTYISYIGSVLSIMGCLIAIVTFQYLSLCNDRVRIHQQLGVSIILVQILFIFVSLTGKDHGTPVRACRTISILLHYSLTSMFCWMLVEGIHLYVVLVKIFELGSHLKKYIAIGWGVPLLVVGICVAIFYDRYGTGDVCWLDHELLLVCFIPTVGLVILINTVILAVVIKTMISSNKLATKINQQEHNNIKTSLKATGVLLPLIGLTWVLGFLAVDTGGRHTMTYIFTYLFTISNSFQGVLFFVFHCLLNVDVHLAYERRFNRKKRLSYAETMSYRARKLSEPDLFSPHPLLNNSKSTITTRSTLTNLSMGDNRSSMRDKDPIIVDDMDRLPRFSMPWRSFNPAILPEPDYPQGFANEDIDDNVFQGSKTPSISSSRRRHNTDSELGSGFIQLPRPQRNSVRFT